MSEGTSPLDQAEAVIRDAAVDLEVEQAKTDAHLLLLSTILGHTATEAGILSRCSMRGVDYMSAVLAATVITARQWSRMFLSNPTIQFGDFLLEHDGEAEHGYHLAHSYVRELLAMEDVTSVGPVIERLNATLTSGPTHTVGQMVTHIVGVCVELLSNILNMHNEEIAKRLGGEGDSRS